MRITRFEACDGNIVHVEAVARVSGQMLDEGGGTFVDIVGLG